MKKTQLLRKIIDNKDRETQIKLMENYFSGETCFVFSCGPSLLDFDKKFFLTKFPNSYVATVKQSFYPFSEVSDFSFFNLGNFTEMKSDKCIFFGSSAIGLNSALRNCWIDQKIHVYDHISDDRNQNNCLAVTKEFSKWKLSNRVNRPWGPGIMYESVFYNLIHMGFKKLFIVGWDYSDPNKPVRHLNHFYNKKQNESGGLKYFRNIAGPMFNGENYLVVESSKDLCHFLHKEGVEAKLISQKSFISEEFKRVKLREIK